MSHSNRYLCVGTRAAALGFVTTVVATLVTTHAQAEPPIKGLVVGMERAFGFVAASREYENDPVTVTNSSVGFSLGIAGNFNVSPVYTRPRLAVDYVLERGITFGGAIGFAIDSYETESEIGNTAVTVKAPTTMFLIAPRGGYLIGINEHFGIWPRAGITVVAANQDNDDDDDNDEGFSNVALSVDVPFLYSVGPMGVFLAPSLDLGIGGGVDFGEEEVDAKATEFGIQFGFFGVF